MQIGCLPSSVHPTALSVDTKRTFQMEQGKNELLCRTIIKNVYSGELIAAQL
jgi:hypothetical protein